MLSLLQVHIMGGQKVGEECSSDIKLVHNRETLSICVGFSREVTEMSDVAADDGLACHILHIFVCSYTPPGCH